MRRKEFWPLTKAKSLIDKFIPQARACTGATAELALVFCLLLGVAGR